jgi:hypothetical protein
MEYINDHGVFDDVPFDFIVDGVRRAYGHLFEADGQPQTKTGSLEQDISDRS